MVRAVSIRLQCLAEQTSGQDLVEYALMAGFVATAAGAIMPGVASSISKIFCTVLLQLSDASREPGG